MAKGKLSDDVARQAKAMGKMLKQTIPEKIIVLAEKNIDQSFKKEQYQDGKSSKWQGRKRDKEGSKSRDARRGLLVESGDLRASETAEQHGMDVIIGSDKEQAQIHNEGGQGMAFGKYPFTMPQRQTMPIPGEEPPFIKELDKFMDDQMDKIFK